MIPQNLFPARKKAPKKMARPVPVYMEVTPPGKDVPRPAIPHKNSETALIFTPFTDKAMLLVCCGDLWKENYHLDTTLLCKGGGN